MVDLDEVFVSDYTGNFSLELLGDEAFMRRRGGLLRLTSDKMKLGSLLLVPYLFPYQSLGLLKRTIIFAFVVRLHNFSV
jgi:hypothetical protein